MADVDSSPVQSSVTIQRNDAQSWIDLLFLLAAQTRTVAKVMWNDGDCADYDMTRLVEDASTRLDTLASQINERVESADRDSGRSEQSLTIFHMEMQNG